MSMKQTRAIKEGYRVYHSDFNRPDDYYQNDKKDFPAVGELWEVLKFKDTNTAIYDMRWQAACEVIDIIAMCVGIDPETSGFNLYGVDWNYKEQKANSRIADKITELLESSGDKVKLKKRVNELEKENEILRSLINKPA